MQRKAIIHNRHLFPPCLSFFSWKQPDLCQLWRSAGSRGDLQPNQHFLQLADSWILPGQRNSQRRGCREAHPWGGGVGAASEQGRSSGMGQTEAHPALWSSSQAPAAGECHCCEFILNIMIHCSAWENFVSGKHDIRVQLGE